MHKEVKNKSRKYFWMVAILAILVVTYYYPFKLENRYCGESPLCKVKFGVYMYSDNAETGEKYFGKNIQLGKKVGGILAYLGIEAIDCINQ